MPEPVNPAGACNIMFECVFAVNETYAECSFREEEINSGRCNHYMWDLTDVCTCKKAQIVALELKLGKLRNG